MDLTKLVAAGFSFGAMTAIECARKIPDFKYCVALDPWFYPMHEELLKNQYTLT